MIARSETFADIKIREAEACGDHARADYWRSVKSKVDEAPALTAEQSARLRILLAPVAPPSPVAHRAAA